MQVFLVLIIILLSFPYIASFPVLLLVVGPAIGWIISTDKVGQSIEGFMGIAFAIIIVSGAAVAVNNTIWG